MFFSNSVRNVSLYPYRDFYHSNVCKWELDEIYAAHRFFTVIDDSYFRVMMSGYK